MKAALHAFARAWWAGDAGPAGPVLDLVTAPMEWAYGAAIAVRNRRFDRLGGVRIEGLRVVSIGNLAAGGTGKTPFSAWVAAYFQTHGVPAALLARGYGADEVALHRRWNPDVDVIVAADRVAAARRAVLSGARIAVLDDAFQHRRIARDLDIVLLAAEDRFPGRLLPRGPFREPASALGRADLIVVTRRTASEASANETARVASVVAPRTPVARLRLQATRWLDLNGAPTEAAHGPVLAAAAIARPEDFARNVATLTGREVELAAYPDHHDFSAADVRGLVARAAGRTLVVTEKDAVKLVRFAAEVGDVRVLAQDLHWEDGERIVLYELRLCTDEFVP